jgi:hypothetical protein
MVLIFSKNILKWSRESVAPHCGKCLGWRVSFAKLNNSKTVFVFSVKWNTIFPRSKQTPRLNTKY